MARLPRYTIINQLQHVILQGRDEQRVFFEEQDYLYFRDCLEAASYNYGLKVHAYVLLPDRVHILATPGASDSVSRTVQSIGRNYVQYYNELYNGVGTLWEGRYRATVVDDKAYMLLCSRYIETAPVRAGLAKHPRDYRWSSFARNADGKTDEVITPHREYRKLGGDDSQRAKAYRMLFKRKINADTIELITASTIKGWALGDDRFVRKIEKSSGRRARQLPKGRPRKKSA